MPQNVETMEYQVEVERGVQVTNTLAFVEGQSPSIPGNFEQATTEKPTKTWTSWLKKKTKKQAPENPKSTPSPSAAPMSASNPLPPAIASNAYGNRGLIELIERTIAAITQGCKMVLEDFYAKVMAETKREFQNPRNESVFALDRLGNICLKHGESQKAVACFEHALHMLKLLFGKDASHPHVIQSLFSLAKAWSVTGNHHKAIVVYQKAIKSAQAVPEPQKNPKWYTQMAEIFENMGKSWDALNEYEAALSCYDKAKKVRLPTSSPKDTSKQSLTVSRSTKRNKLQLQKKNNLSVILE